MKKLIRQNKKLLGVCGGLGEYFELDPVWFRLAFLISVLLYGTGIFLYIIIAIITPEEAKNKSV